jgi:hypothetical protein
MLLSFVCGENRPMAELRGPLVNFDREVKSPQPIHSNAIIVFRYLAEN